MHLRPIKPSDNKKLATIIREVFHEHDAPQAGTVYSDPTTDHLYELFQDQKRAILWVAEVNDEVVGCCGIYPTPNLPENCVELVKFYLAEKARGKGIGKALFLKSIASAGKMGYKNIYLESLPDFDKAVTMYKNEGFEMLNKPLGKSGHPGCDIWMIKHLN